jgi:plasmid stabilization system protein ParE
VSFAVVIGRTAREEIADAVYWIFQRSPDAAMKWLDGMEQTIAGLAEFPTRCPLAPESDVTGSEIRQQLYGRRQHKYRILFVIRGQTVHVLHVRHGARDFLFPSDFDDIE